MVCEVRGVGSAGASGGTSRAMASGSSSMAAREVDACAWPFKTAETISPLRHAALPMHTLHRTIFVHIV